MTITTMVSNKGFKRVCGGCTARFYDFNKTPIVCPKCGEEFSGAVKIKSRRSRKSADEDAVATAAATNAGAASDFKDDGNADDNTVSMDDLKAQEDADLDEDEEDLNIDLDELADIDDEDSDDFEDGDDLDLSRVTSDS